MLLLSIPALLFTAGQQDHSRPLPAGSDPGSPGAPAVWHHCGRLCPDRRCVHAGRVEAVPAGAGALLAGGGGRAGGHDGGRSGHRVPAVPAAGDAPGGRVCVTKRLCCRALWGHHTSQPPSHRLRCSNTADGRRRGRLTPPDVAASLPWVCRQQVDRHWQACTCSQAQHHSGACRCLLAAPA